MNIDELKRSLTAIADETTDTPETEVSDRLAGVDHKVTRRRRGTALGAVAVAAVAVAAVAMAPNLIDRSEDRTPPADRQHGSIQEYDTPLATVEDKGVSFYASPAGARLIGHAVTTPGQQSETFTVTPESRNLSYVFECFSTGLQRPPTVELRVNGSWISEGRCQPHQDPEPLKSGTRPGSAGWRDVGVSPGQPFEVTMRITPTDAGLPGVAQVQLAAGFYEESGDAVEKDGVVLDRQLVHEGHTYAFRELTTAPAPTDSRRTTMTVDTTRLGDDLVAVYGLHGHATASFWGTVEGENQAGASGSGWAMTVPLHNDGAADLALVRRGSGDDEALRYLAVYERID